jgi:hypothetical protein
MLARCLAMVMAAGALTVAGPAVQRSDAAPSLASACSGRPAKTFKFATGELRIYKNRQYACAMTVSRTPGVRRAMSVLLQARGGRPEGRKGTFTHQVGPVSVHALNRCVRATGAISGKARSTGWILC